MPPKDLGPRQDLDRRHGPSGRDDLHSDLGAFVAARGQALVKFAFLLSGGHADQAEDLVHNVLARLVTRGLTGLDDPLAYVRRGIVNEYRSIGRHADVHRRAMPRLVASQDTATPAAAPEDRLTMLAALADLSERERAAIVLRYYEDLPDEEIAAVLGCSRPTVRSLVHRALPKLRARLGDTYRPGGTADQPGKEVGTNG